MSRAGEPSRAGPWWRTPRQRQLAMRLTPAAAVLVPLRLQIGDMGDAGFRGGPSERIATRRGRTDRLSRFRKTENDFDFSK